jgi:hypothetical protein
MRGKAWIIAEFDSSAFPAADEDPALPLGQGKERGCIRHPQTARAGQIQPGAEVRPVPVHHRRPRLFPRTINRAADRLNRSEIALRLSGRFNPIRATAPVKSWVTKSRSPASGIARVPCLATCR